MEQLRAFVEGNEAVDFQPRDRDEAYGFVRDTLDRFGYRGLGKRDKGVVLRFLVTATGISRQQMERLVRQWRETGSIRDRRGGGRGRPFARRYTGADIRRLAEVDEAYDQMSGLATREVLRRQFEVFGETDYARLAAISNGHVYNLRGSATYRAARTAWTKTKGTAVNIGLRQAPEPEGMPGHVRVDTVHQGDRDGVKGIYLINLVDEVTQFEFVGAVVGSPLRGGDGGGGRFPSRAGEAQPVARHRVACGRDGRVRLRLVDQRRLAVRAEHHDAADAGRHPALDVGGHRRNIDLAIPERGGNGRKHTIDMHGWFVAASPHRVKGRPSSRSPKDVE